MIERTATMDTSSGTDRRIYPRPPIVEAIIEVQYRSEASHEVVYGALHAALSETYSGAPRMQKRVQLAAQVVGDSIESSTKTLPDLTFLRTPDGLRQIGIAPNVLSIHVLAPYPGWERFVEQARAAISALPGEARQGGITALGVRYIDRIVLPDGNVQRYLTVMPSRPSNMPAELSGYHLLTEAIDPRDGTRAVLAIVSGPPVDGRPSLIYDLNVRRSGDTLCGFANDEWRPIVETLHKRQRDIFEESITNEMRELFL